MSPARSLADAIGTYLCHLDAVRAPALASVRSTLRRIPPALSSAPLAGLKPHMVTAWIDGVPTWSDGMRYQAWQRLKTATQWYVSQGYADADPLASAARPRHYRPRPRGQDFHLPAGLVDEIVRSCGVHFRPFVSALASTGARPGELANAFAGHYQPLTHVIVHRGDEAEHYRHKTARTKRYGTVDRVIHLDAETEGVVRVNAGKGGPLFPTGDGKTWNGGRIARAWNAMLRDASVRAVMAREGKSASHVVPYSLRHTWITNAALSGISAKVIAELTGTSVSCVERHYCHAGADRASMRAAFMAASSRRTSGSP